MDTKNILIAEDEPNDVFFIRRCFARASLLNPLHFVSDGEQVIEYLLGKGAFADRKKFEMPSILILDLRMPKTSGFEVLEWLKAQSGLQHLQKIVLASTHDAPEIAMAYDLGADAHLVKPPETNALMEVLNRLNNCWTVVKEAQTRLPVRAKY